MNPHSTLSDALTVPAVRGMDGPRTAAPRPANRERVMSKRPFAIMGATGHIGRALVEELLNRGHEVRALGRDPGKLGSLRAKGAMTPAVPFDDAGALAGAFRGAAAVFSFIPPSYGAEDFGAYQDRVGEAIATALKRAGATHVVNLSSLGAHLPDGTGPINGLHRHEKRLDALPGLALLHLRPGYFMENLLWSIPTIRERGVNGSPLRGDLAVHMVATKDIGAKAADLLDGLDFRGRSVLEFVGPRTVTMNAATSALGEAIGRPDLKYVQVPYADAERAMLVSGMKESIAGLMTEMSRAMNEGKIGPTRGLAAENRGKTTIEEFAQVFARAFAGT